MQSLILELQAAAQQQLFIYALVDPTLQPLVSKSRLSRGRTPLGVRGVDGDEVIKVLPYLIPVDMADADIAPKLDTMMGWARESFGLTLIASHQPIDALARALRQRMDIELPDNMPAVLRFADARILKPLYDVLDDQQRKRFFSIARHWWYWDRHDQLQQLQLLQTGTQEDWPMLTLNEHQQNTLLHCAEPDTVLRLLHENASANFIAIPQPQQFAFVTRQIALAGRWQIAAPIDQALFCMIALEQGSDFSQTPVWQAPLAAVREGKLSLLEAITAATAGAEKT